MTLIAHLDHPNIGAETLDPRALYAAARAGDRLPAGQYAFAWEEAGEVRLVRDPVGLNKLFHGVRDDGAVIVASRLGDMLAQGIALDRVASCPPGHAVAIGGGRAGEPQGHDLSSVDEAPDFELGAFHARVRRKLTDHLDRLGRQFPDSVFAVCLSGGLDSTAIAALAAARLPRVTAVCFSYLPAEGFRDWLAGAPLDRLPGLSDDFRTAREIAAELRLPFVPVFRPKEAVAAVIPAALRLCQDWRDFNVHCAVVNLFLAQDIRARWPGQPVVVLTGDLMNELVCDYHEELFDGVAYYPQPKVPLGRRRRFFVRGLDAGDREIGVFNGFGLTLCQPFAAVAEDYMAVPAALLDAPDAKLALNGHLLPPGALAKVGRVKQRAQVGGADGGTLGVFHRLGLRQADLLRLWAEDLPAGRGGERPEDIIQFGRYRTTPREA